MALKRKTPTISDIKYDTLATAPYFFDSKTMKFFGQTMKDFRVRKSPKGRIFIFATSGAHGVRSFRWYVKGKRMGYGKLYSIRSLSMPTYSQIESYIAAH